MTPDSAASKTLLAVSIVAETAEEMLRRAEAARRAGADIVELRLDWLSQPTPQTVRHLVANRPCPIICTARPVWEGGRFAGAEDERIRLLEAAATAGSDYIDIELKTWKNSSEVRTKIAEVRRTGEARRTRLIISLHDFQATPADLNAIFEELAETRADVVKVATHAQHICDSIRMLDAVRASRKPAIGICMGPAGVITRVLAGKVGAMLSFCSLQAGSESAAGQIPIGEMLDLYRFRRISTETAVFGVIGCPVGHSMSPLLHNTAYAELGLDAVYLPLHVEPQAESFTAFVDAALARPELRFHGFSVTIPHKLNALKRADWREPLAEKIGAANTLQITETGQVRAYNTDYAGALRALCEGMGISEQALKDRRVAVLGAGGAARAIVAGLVDRGCRVTIYNRTHQKAVDLARQFGCAAARWEDRAQLDAEILINCTSVGMWPDVEQMPIPPEALKPGMVVFDTVYNPPETALLKEAERRGCLTIDGVAMFVHQAAMQMQIWFGKSPSLEKMRELVLRRLSAHDSRGRKQ